MRRESAFTVPPGRCTASNSSALASRIARSAWTVMVLSRSWRTAWIGPGSSDRMVTRAPAPRSAFTGSVSSVSSKPSVARTATRKSVSRDMMNLPGKGASGRSLDIVAGCVPTHGESGAARSATTAALRRGSRASTAQESHHRLGVTVSRGGSPGGQLLEPPQVIVGQGHVEGLQVLAQVCPPLGAEDRYDVLAPGQHPGQRQLRRRAAQLLCQLGDPPDEVEVPLEVLA